MAKRFYLGLAVTYHDPALAIVAEEGEVLHAEAAERPLQSKRAINADPDALHHIGPLLRAHCGADAELRVAFNWQKHRPWHEVLSHRFGYFEPAGLIRRARRPTVSGFLERYKLFHMLASQHYAIRRAGLNLARVVGEWFPDYRVRFAHYDHHLCHAALACYASPFDEAACLVIDSFGERGGVAAFRMEGGRIEPLGASRGLASPGFYYMKLTEACGFDWLAGEEWKTMGLAAYGRPIGPMAEALGSALRVRGWNLDIDRGALEAILQQWNGVPSVADLAHTGQACFAELMMQWLRLLHRRAPLPNLALGGGCALNSAANGQILRNTPFEELYVPPAPADDGTALGAAWLAWAEDHPGRRPPPGPLSAALGSRLAAEGLQRLRRHGGYPHLQTLPAPELDRRVVELLARGAIVGWAMGRAEFGPRALGQRSILADPRDPAMKDRLNARVKFREEFRPFAPAILHEHGPEYFDPYEYSPYMERALPFRPEMRARVPAVVHVDGSGRLQSVTRELNPRLHGLISAFRQRTGIPLLLNTSLNRMGKPIVHSVEDAMALFCTSGLDALVLEDLLLTKEGGTG